VKFQKNLLFMARKVTLSWSTKHMLTGRNRSIIDCKVSWKIDILKI